MSLMAPPRPSWLLPPTEAGRLNVLLPLSSGHKPFALAGHAAYMKSSLVYMQEDHSFHGCHSPCFQEKRSSPASWRRLARVHPLLRAPSHQSRRTR